MKTKFRIYAIFQFMSFMALLALLVATVLLIYEGTQATKTVNNTEFWGEAIKDTLIFSAGTTRGVMASIFVYSTLVLWVFTWIAGWFILRIKHRNLFDSLFLLFLMIPLVSNLFALFAQMSLKETDYTSASIDKKELKEATKALIKEATAANNGKVVLPKKEKAQDTVVIEETITQEIKVTKPKAKKAPAKKVAKKPAAKKAVKKPVAKKAPAKKATTTKKKATTKK